MLAVRLYSGPCYQPINEFLRQLGALVHGGHRYQLQLAQNLEITFAATVGVLCRAIRKLSNVSPPTMADTKLYRAVRGELPRTFWLPDAQGMVCAVDMAFTSTSRNRETPVSYMDGGGPNVLWVLHQKPPSDAGVHRGASISMLSQFEGEDEVLFPPCTILTVQEADASSVHADEAEPSCVTPHGAADAGAVGEPDGASAVPLLSNGRAAGRRRGIQRDSTIGRKIAQARLKLQVVKRSSSDHGQGGRPAPSFEEVHALPMFV